MPNPDNRTLTLAGLDGANLLGFLASVGTLRTLALAEPGAEWRMKWGFRGGAWTLDLLSTKALSTDMVCGKLDTALRRDATPEFDFAKNLSVTPEEFRNGARDAQGCALRHDRGFADFMVSFGSETFGTRDGKKIQDTAFRTMNGAGHQHFLGTMQDLATEVTVDALRRSLFDSWDYADRKLGLRWDPEEDRRYALRWETPSDGKGVPTMHGANRLAVEALPLLPTAQGARQLRTTGVSRRNRDKSVFVTWPVWEDSLSVDVVRSLLALRELQAPRPDRITLGARGIVEVYRCQRINNGKYRNFTRAVPA